MRIKGLWSEISSADVLVHNRLSESMMFEFRGCHVRKEVLLELPSRGQTVGALAGRMEALEKLQDS
jgi:hypothetical protein